MGPIRTFSCLNRRCQFTFDSEFDHPPCPHCRGLRVQWVPRPVAIASGRSAAIDKTARELAADFGLSNFRSPVAGKSAIAPPAPATPPPQRGEPMTFEPLPGWRVKMPDSALQGTGHAICTTTGVTAKVKVDPNAGALSETANPAMSIRAMRAATRIE